MKYTKQEEKEAKIEYLLMIDTLKSSTEFSNDWVGQWDDFEKTGFADKKHIVKGDKEKYMRYWIENQKIINDISWNVIDKDEDDEYF